MVKDFKFKALWDILQGLKEVYKTSELKEKEYIQTVVGAAIFYLPTTKKTFSGFISEEASKLDKKLWVKEHQYPRKYAAKLLLESPPNSVEELKELFYTKIGVWNWVTKKENSSLRKFQKVLVFSSPEESYEKANIKLIPL